MPKMVSCLVKLNRPGRLGNNTQYSEFTNALHILAKQIICSIQLIFFFVLVEDKNSERLFS